MKDKVLGTLVVLAIGMGGLLVIPAAGHAQQVFNSSGNGGGSADGKKPLFNSTKKGEAPADVKPFVSQGATPYKPTTTPLRMRSATPGSNNGFNRPPGSSDVSDSDRIFREMAMRRVAAAKAESDAIEADTARRAALPDTYGTSENTERQDRRFGAIMPGDLDANGQIITEEDKRRQVYDKHNKDNVDPSAPPRLFNRPQ